jgi:phage gpG-like protein
MISVALTGDQALADRLSAMPGALHDGIGRAIARLNIALQAKVQQNLSGDVLNLRTGALRASITVDAGEDATGLSGRVGSDLPYAAINEFGGQTPAHDIEVRKAKALAFMLGGKLVFARHVHHPGSRIPARSFLRSALDDMAPDIAAELQDAVMQAVSR